VFEKKDEYFPIKQDPACQLKWTWSKIILTEGTTSSCHRCLEIPIDENNFDNFHNLPHKIKEREIMLEGKWPTIDNGGSGHCTYCKKIEDAGGLSDRMHHLNIPNLTPTELLKNNKATIVTPKILEIFINNTCNMKCIYCQPRNSSQLAAEIKKYGPIKKLSGEKFNNTESHENIKKHRYFFEQSLGWIEKYGNNLRRLHLAGGEPFYQSELQEILDVLKKLKNPNLELNVISNLMVQEHRYKNYIEQIKYLCKGRHIGRFDLTASIDGFGEGAEYARSGLNSERWKKLFEYTINEKWIYLNTNQTITSLTIKCIPDLIKYINTHRKNRKINQHFSLVDGRPWLHPSAYGKEFWQNDIKNILLCMPENNRDELMAKKYMAGCFVGLSTEPDQTQIKELKNYLDEIDKRRNTNWRKIFSYLDI